MLIFKRVGAALAGSLVFAVLIALYWASTPIKVDPHSSDASVIHANTIRASDHTYREAYFEYQERRLHYVEAGKGDVILFIHGFPSYWYSFIRQMDALKSNYRVVAIDGLGAGRSDAPHDIDAYKLEAMTAHIDALIDHLGADKIHIVGHDWGAAFALGFAQRYPERVHTVTGLSAPPQSVILELLEASAAQRETFAYIERFKKANPLLLLATGIERRIWEGAYEPLVTDKKLSEAEGQLFRDATGNPKRINAHINWYRANIPSPEAIKTNDYWPSRSARITVPALFIWGNEDWIISTEAIDEIQSISDDIVMLPLEGVGHWPQIEQADQVTSSIRALLSKSELTPPAHKQ